MTIADLIKMAQSRIRSAEATIATFASDLSTDPEYAVTWGTGLFSATANLVTWKFILNMAQDACTFDLIVENVHDYMVSAAVRPGYSSNFASNHLDQEKTRALGEAYRELHRRQKHMQKIAAAQVPTA